jgi:hypothetical protein
VTLRESILLAIVDKLLIGLVIAALAYFLNRRLEKLKGQIALQNAAGPARSAAYGKLWRLTEHLTPRDELSLPRERASRLFESLRAWYYADGNAMYLSLDSADLLLNGLLLLDGTGPIDSAKTRKVFSDLRTQLKVDMGIYSARNAKVKIPRRR